MSGPHVTWGAIDRNAAVFVKAAKSLARLDGNLAETSDAIERETDRDVRGALTDALLEFWKVRDELLDVLSTCAVRE
jgi:hypothetical protein